MVLGHDFDDIDAIWWLSIYIHIFIWWYCFDNINGTMIMDMYWWCHEMAYGYGIHDIYDDEMIWESSFIVMVMLYYWSTMDWSR